MQVPESWLADAFNAVVAAIAGAIAWAVRNTWGRIRKLEDCTVRKTELEKVHAKIDSNHRDALPRAQFEEFAERAETDRRELRESVVRVSDTVDEIKTILIEKNRDG